jgi:hypothetical protein
MALPNKTTFDELSTEVCLTPIIEEEEKESPVETEKPVA